MVSLKRRDFLSSTTVTTVAVRVAFRNIFLAAASLSVSKSLNLPFRGSNLTVGIFLVLSFLSASFLAGSSFWASFLAVSSLLAVSSFLRSVFLFSSLGCVAFSLSSAPRSDKNSSELRTENATKRDRTCMTISLHNELYGAQQRCTQTQANTARLSDATPLT